MPSSPVAHARPSDGRRSRGIESRRAIIEGAIDSIARRGLGGTTIDTVAERAGVSRSLVLFHFKSKNRLHIEVLNELGARFAEGWDAILEGPESDGRERLLSLLAYDVGFVVEHPRYVAVWQAVWGEARGSTLYREVSFPRDRRYMADVRGLLLSLADLPASEIDVILKGLEAMVFGFWWQQRMDPQPDHEAAAMRALSAYLSASIPGFDQSVRHAT